jgi:hypothetical protein
MSKVSEFKARTAMCAVGSYGRVLNDGLIRRHLAVWTCVNPSRLGSQEHGRPIGVDPVNGCISLEFG